MGSYAHHAIIVTGNRLLKDDNGYSFMVEAREEASLVFGAVGLGPGEFVPDLVSPLIDAPLNGICAFFIAPDGSKEERAESDLFDAARTEFLDYLRRVAEDYGDGGPFEWAEVAFPDADGGMTRVTRARDYSKMGKIDVLGETE